MRELGSLSRGFPISSLHRSYSHGKVGDEGSFGNLNVKHDVLRLWGVVHHFGLDDGVGHTRSNSGLDFIAIKSYLISLFLLLARKHGGYAEQNYPELQHVSDGNEYHILL